MSDNPKPDFTDQQISDKAKEIYQLRLFLSVDLINSTNYKFSFTGENQGKWTTDFTGFYKDFDINFTKNLKSKSKETHRPLNVKWYKALGDEIIYTAIIDDCDSAKLIVGCFIDSIKHIRGLLKDKTKILDLKGSAWLANFPINNHEFLPSEHFGTSDEKQNKTENDPTDFIGPSMDTGFRIGKFSDRSKMMITVDLAYILSATEGWSFSTKFGYDHRGELKGVPGRKGYPLIWLHTEDNEAQRNITKQEKALTKIETTIQREDIFAFCQVYLGTDSTFIPYLKNETGNKEFFSTIPEDIKTEARNALQKDVIGETRDNSPDDSSKLDAKKIAKDVITDIRTPEA